MSQPVRLNFRDILLEINIDRKYSSLDFSHAQRRLVDIFETCIRVYFGKAHLKVALFSSAVICLDGNKVQSWKSDKKRKSLLVRVQRALKWCRRYWDVCVIRGATFDTTSTIFIDPVLSFNNQIFRIFHIDPPEIWTRKRFNRHRCFGHKSPRAIILNTYRLRLVRGDILQKFSHSLYLWWWIEIKHSIFCCVSMQLGMSQESQIESISKKLNSLTWRSQTANSNIL